MLLFVPVALIGAAVAGVAALSGWRGEPTLGFIAAAASGIALALVYLIYAGVPFAFVQLTLAHDPEARPTEIVRACFALVRGNRWNVIGVVWMEELLGLAGVLACCVGVLPALALAQLVHAGLFLALRNDRRPLEANLGQITS